MSIPAPPPPAMLFLGVLFASREARDRAFSALRERFGPMIFLSEPEPFRWSSYYEAEMGPGLLRQYAAFETLVPEDALPAIKLQTNAVESREAPEGRRLVNLDPGLLTEERLLLATGKPAAHRVYLGSGMFAEVTLVFERRAFRPLPWTYPDFREPRLLHFLAALRETLKFFRSGRLPRKAPGKDAP